MSSSESPFMHALASQMNYLRERQGVLAQNIANIDTPNYKAKDVKSPDFSKLVTESQGKLQMTVTSPRHIPSSSHVDAYPITEVENPTEITPNGNTVSMDTEMAKISDTGAQYDMSSSMFKKFTAMYRNALGK